VFLCLREKIAFTGSARLFYRGPNPAASFGDLLITFAPRAPLEVFEAISCKNQMRVRIDESRQHNAPTSVNDLCILRFLFDLAAGPDTFDLVATNEHSAIANNCQLGHFRPDARPCWTSQRDQLRDVKNSK
jgi:hypothetical protein